MLAFYTIILCTLMKGCIYKEIFLGVSTWWTSWLCNVLIWEFRRLDVWEKGGYWVYLRSLQTCSAQWACACALCNVHVGEYWVGTWDHLKPALLNEQCSSHFLKVVLIWYVSSGTLREEVGDEMLAHSKQECHKSRWVLRQLKPGAKDKTQFGHVISLEL